MHRFVLRVLGCAWVAATVAQAAPLAAPAAGPAGAGATAGDDRLQLGVGGWFSSGDSEWQISFPGGRSLLEWADLEGDLPYVEGEVRVLPWLALGARYGQGDVEGNNTDRDWVGNPGGLLGEVLISKSTAQTSGETTLLDANTYVRLNPASLFPNAVGTLDLLVGYQQYTEELNDRNGIDGDGRRFAGLDSTFDFEWDIIRVGLRGQWPVRSWLRLKGEVAALVAADYHGEGFWNLRDDYKRTPPNFEQDADGGDGVDARVSVEFRPLENVSVEVGYWLFDLKVEDGRETTYFVDRTRSSEPVDYAQSARDGLFAAVGVRF